MIVGRSLRLLGWGLATVLVSAWLALAEVFWLPLRVGGVLVPVSLVVAVTANLLLPATALRLTGSRSVAVLPGVVWLVVAIGAMLRRPEGDLVITGGGVSGTVNLAFLLLGVLAAALAVGRVLGGGRPVSPDAGSPAPGRAGSGTGGAR
jgi:hypothetical protein